MSELNAGNAGTVDANAAEVSAAPGTTVDNAWLSSVPENLRDNDVLKGHASLPEALQQYVDLKVKSADMIARPTDKSTPEDIAAYRKVMGVPDTIEGYELTKPDDFPEEMLYDITFPTKWVETFKEAGVTKEVAQLLHKQVMEHSKEVFRQFNEAKAERETAQMEALKDVWKGQDFEKKSAETFDVLQRFAAKSSVPEGLGGVEGLKAWAEGNKTDPMTNWILSEFFKHIGNDSFEKGAPLSKEGTGGSWYPNTPK